MKLVKVEYPEKYVVKLTFAADAAQLEAAAQVVYEKTRGAYKVDGFARGEADRAAIEAEKGEHVFWYDAINDVMDAEVQALIDAATAENGWLFSTEFAYDLVSVTKEDGFVTTATAALKPELTLGAYRGFSAKCVPAKVEDKDVERNIERARSQNVELVPHKGPAVKGNIVFIDYEGKVNGHPFKGGKAENAQVTLGSRQMIPGFEEGIIGHSAGDEFDINVTFPEHYPEKLVAGKEAVFHIKLHSANLRQIPALNADFAKKVGGVDTMDEYRAQVRARLEDAQHRIAMGFAQNMLLDQLGKNVTGELPTLLVDQKTLEKTNEMRTQLQMRGLTVNQFLQQTKRTREEYDQILRERAEMELRVGYGLELLAKAEGIAPTDAEVAESVNRQVENSGKTLEELEKLTGKDITAQHRTRLTNERARAWLFEHCTITEE